jgi:protein-tyrosine-phosphatase
LSRLSGAGASFNRGWMRHLAGDRVDVFTGGSEPAEELNRGAVAAMAERGIRDEIGRRVRELMAELGVAAG